MATSVHETHPEQLSELALKAALQIDDILRKRSGSTERIARLTENLRNRQIAHEEGDGQRLMFDASNFEAFNYAVEAYLQNQLNSLDELRDKYLLLVGELEQASSLTQEQKLRNLMRFCVTLHEKLRSQSEMLTEESELGEELRA